MGGNFVLMSHKLWPLYFSCHLQNHIATSAYLRGTSAFLKGIFAPSFVSLHFSVPFTGISLLNTLHPSLYLHFFYCIKVLCSKRRSHPQYMAHHITINHSGSLRHRPSSKQPCHRACVYLCLKFFVMIMRQDLGTILTGLVLLPYVSCFLSRLYPLNFCSLGITVGGDVASFLYQLSFPIALTRNSALCKDLKEILSSKWD